MAEQNRLLERGARCFTQGTMPYAPFNLIPRVERERALAAELLQAALILG